MRVDYGSEEKDGSPDLDVDWLADGWVVLLRKWIDDAERAGVAEPNAMVLATVDAGGRPMSRTVLCKSVDDTGITFFTNYDSAKGAELAANPYASATFPWFALGRQVHVRGVCEQSHRGGHRRLLVQAPARFATGRVGVGAVTADRVAGRAAATTRTRSPSASPTSSTSRFRRTGVATCSPPRPSSSGRAARTGCTTGFGCSRGRSSASSPSQVSLFAALALRARGSSPTPPRCEHRTSVGCGWPASSPSSGRT